MSVQFSNIFDAWTGLSINPAAGSWDGTTLTITTTSADWLFSLEAAFQPGQQISSAALNLSVPAGSAGGSYNMAVAFSNAAGTVLSTVYGPSTPIATGATVDLGIPHSVVTAPSGTTKISISGFCAAGASGRKIVRNSANYLTIADVDDVLSLNLRRPLHRLAADSGLARTPAIASGVPGSREGVLTCLLSSIAAATPLDTLCAAGKITVPASVAGAALTLWPTDIRFATEKAIPGKPARCIATIDVKEA